MEIRSGFVSNSSTSSFVMVGFEIDASKKEENLAKLADFLGLPQTIEVDEKPFYAYNEQRDIGVFYLASREQGCPKEGQHIIGVPLETGDDFAPNAIALNTLMSKTMDLRVAFDMPREAIKLILGHVETYMLRDHYMYPSPPGETSEDKVVKLRFPQNLEAGNECYRFRGSFFR